VPDPIKKQLIRQLDDLSPHELRVVHDLIDAFKGRSGRVLDEEHRSRKREEAERSEETARASASKAARRVRETLAEVPGALSETVIEERRERL